MDFFGKEGKMREDKNNDRVSRRSSTGMKKGAPERERRQRIRMFEDTDDLYGNDGNEQADSARHDRDRSEYDDRRRNRYEEERRRDDEYDRYEREDRRRDRRYEDEYDSRGERRDRYEEESRRDRGDREQNRREQNRRREPAHRQTGGKKRTGTGGDTERFAHQIIPYVMFWVALFAAASLVLRDIVGLDGSTGAFGSWFADFLCGLLGPIAYALPIFFVVIALRWKKFVRENILAKKLLLSATFLVLLSAIVHVFLEGKANRGVVDVNGAALYTAGMNMTGGGFFGGFVGEYIGYVLRAVGTGLLCIPLLIIIGIYLVGLTPSELWQRLAAKCKLMADRRRERARARYNGAEERRLHQSRRDKEGVVKYEEKKKLRSEKKPQGEDVLQYEFRKEEDEPVVPPRRVARKDAEAPEADDVVELVDIPDDEPEMEMPVSKTDTVSHRTGGLSDSRRALQDILDQLQQEAQPPHGESPHSEMPPAESREERPLRGTYYSPFGLKNRTRPSEMSASDAHRDTDASRPDSTPVDSRAEKSDTAVNRAGETPAAPRASVYRNDPVSVSPVMPATEEEQPAARTFAPVETPAVPVEEVKRPMSGMTFADDDEDDSDDAVQTSPVTAFVPFERERITEKAPVMTTEENEEKMTPAQGVRTAFPLSGEEPAQKPPREESAPVRAKVPARTEPVKSAPAPAPEPPPVLREYRFPPLTLLNEDKSVKNVDHSEENREKIEILRDTLASFNVRIRDQIECARGPAITRYEFRPEIGVSVRQVINRQDDIALALAADVRIEAPVPGKPAIGIEVPNAVRETVYMRTLLESDKFRKSEKPLEVPIGMGIGGNIVTCDLASMPHLLVAGTTGSGKSVCINTILISLMYKTTPRDLRLILIDPKQVEFAAYAHVPHLYLPIVTEMPRAVGALACAVQEMERRYSLMKDVGVRNIEEYNDVTKNDPDREHLPYMVIVIDEFADLKMGSTTNDPENYTCRIAQKARAAGMHLIIGTQRPSVDVITGKLKNNIPSRIAFTVKQQVDSRTILDANGAESLCGRGDMLYLPVTDNKPSRVQGAFVSSGEVERVITYIRDHNEEVQYNRAFMEQIEVEMARAANTGRKGDDFDDVEDGEDGGEDPKFREAVELAIETQKVATSLLQRRLGVGYGRAAKIIDRMEDLGYVSAPEGNKARKVLITYQEFMAKLGGSDDSMEEDDYNN